MNAPSSPSDAGRGRRLLVMLVIATAAAAVTAGVALKDRPNGAGLVTGADASPALDASVDPPAAAPDPDRREPRPDSRRRHAPLSESAPTWVGATPRF